MSIYSFQSVNNVLQHTKIFSDRRKYLFLKLEKTNYPRLMPALADYHDGYTEVINDKNELSLIISKNLWESKFSEFKVLDSMGEIAIITCDVTVETVTGYLLAIVGILSPHNISVFVQ